MSGEAIITLIAVAVILVVFGIPLYVVRRRNRIQFEESEQERPNMEVTLVNDVSPQNTQGPAITSVLIAVDPNPVSPIKPARKRAKKKATISSVSEKKTAQRSKSKTGNTGKTIKKDLKEVADMDKNASVISNDFVLDPGLKLDKKQNKTNKKTTKTTKSNKKTTKTTNSNKKTTKTTKTIKKSAPKSKKSK